MRFTSLASVVFSVVCAGICTDAAAQATKLVNTFNDWNLYTYESPQARICFAAAKPRSTEPPKARREAILFYVTAWPKEGVKSEVSTKIGYTFKKDSDVTVTVGGSTFKLFTKDERAFVRDAAEELRLIEALKKGSSMVVEGTSERGTVTKDTYSLSGLGAALQALAANCF